MDSKQTLNQAKVQSPYGEVLKQHNETVREANKKANQLHQQFMTQVKNTYFLVTASYIILSLTSLGLLAFSIYTVFIQAPSTYTQIFGLVTFIVGIVLITLLFTNNPLRNNRRTLTELMRINVIFTGYMRQIHQIDAEFRRAILTESDASQKLELRKQVQLAMEQTIEMLTLSIDELIE